jgi:hypothetical protein
MIEENDRTLKAIQTELEDFEERCSEEFQATQADWDCWRTDWQILFSSYISSTVRQVDQLTPEQKEHLSALILRARGHKEEILQHKYAYPKLIDQDFEWMKG